MSRVTSLEAAINVLGNADSPALKLLQEALSKARKATQVAPVGERLETCTQFIERARKRLEKSNLELEKIQAERARLAAELAEGQARLVLRTEAGSAAPTQPPAPMDVGAELKRMQAVIDDLLRERSQWKGAGCGGRHNDPNGCGDTRGQSFRAHGSHDRRVEGASSSVCQEPGTSLRCAARYGEAAHPGPPRLRILLDSASQWSQVPIVAVEEGTARMDPTSTVAASQGAIARNLVQFGGHEQATRVDSETGCIRSEPQGGSDTESIAGISEQGVAEVVDATLAEAPVDFAPRATQYSESLACLDGVSLRDVFDTSVMHSVPFFLRGAFRGALKVSLQSIMRGYEQHSDLRITRGWKFFMLLPRMLLFRPRRGGKVHRKTLEERFHMFQEGRWLELLSLSRGIEAVSTSHLSDAALGRGRMMVSSGSWTGRTVWCVWESCPQLGRRWMAPGTLTTLRELTNPARRPPVPRHELSQEILRSEPVEAFELDGDALLTCLRTARRGAGEGDCPWRHCSAIGGENHREAVCQKSRGGDRTIPMWPFNEGVCRTHCAGPHRPRYRPGGVAIAILVGRVESGVVKSRVAPFWSSWADCIHMIKQRHPKVAEALIVGIAQDPSPCFAAVRHCQGLLDDAGLDIPSWRSLANTPPMLA